MKLSDLFKSAFQSLVLNKRRSILSMLGIVIGIASVITILSVGNGINQRMHKLVGADKSGDVTERIFYSENNEPVNGFESADINIVKASPYADKITSVNVGRTNGDETTTLSGMVGNQSFSNWSVGVPESGHAQGNLLAGRNLKPTDFSTMQKVVVLKDTYAKTLYGSAANAVNQSIMFGDTAYTVVGVVHKSDDGIIQLNTPVNATIPFSTFESTASTEYPMLQLKIPANEKPGKIAEKITKYLQKNGTHHGNGSYDFYDAGSQMEQLSSYVSAISIFISAVAAISLFIAGIGVMNMMYISVSERTQEIGIRLAVGATERNVLWQFLIEATVLSVVGGLIGLGIGAGVGQLIAVALSSYHITSAVTFANVVMVLGVSTAIGVIFGWLPARQASRKNLIDILR